MKRYYITKQLIYITVDEVDDKGNHSVVSRTDGMITFRAHVYTSAISFKPSTNDICYHKLKDDVLVSIPFNTPSIIL